jgi:DNA-binding transcriptional regulator YiaG
VCGFLETLGLVERFCLDSLSRTTYLWAVKAKRLEMGPEDVFRLRSKMNMTQRQFGDAVGVDPVTVSRWERGTTKVSTAYATLIRQTVDGLRDEARQERAPR